MSEKSDDSPATVVVCVGDATDVRHVEERLRRIGTVDCRVVTSPLVASPDAAVLQLTQDAPIADAPGSPDCVLSLDCSDDALRTAVELLTKIAKLRHQLHHAHRTKDDLATLAATDSLTGLPNRRAWDDALAQATRAGEVRPQLFCIAILDLDEFKGVNDRHGHAVGDGVLQAAAEGLRRAIRRDDLAARLGGDEFALLLSGLPAASAKAVVDRIRRSIGDAITAAGLPATTCSAGFAPTDVDADLALRRAKQAGRNRTCGPS
jgi:diguanylate cyclase (GGDEF)-like protein